MLNPIEHPICFAKPRRLLPRTPAWQEHIPFAMLLVTLLKPKVIVEIGTHYGVSYCAFCQAVKGANLETRCYAIDTWQGDPHSGLYGIEVLEDLRAHHDPLYGSFSELIQSTFDAALQHFTDKSIDILHIDGYHTYEAIKHDFESWLPKISAQGVVLIHDTNVRERDFGVRRFWDEIKSRYRHFEFLHCNGLGLLAVGEVHSRELAGLLDATDEEAAAIREFFFQIGHMISLQLEGEAKGQALRQTKTDLDRALQDNDELKRTASKRVAELSTEKSALEMKLSTAEKHVAELTSELEVIRRSVSHRIMMYLATHINRIFPDGTSRGEFRKILVKSAQIAADQGVRSLLVHVRRKISRREFRIVELGTSYVRNRGVRDAYEDLLARDELTAEREKEILDDLSEYKTKPRISVLTPTHNTDRNWLESMIRSVLDQLYENWELCICDDGSRQEVWDLLEAYAVNESRIRLVRLTENSGVAKASNQALRLATGEYVALVDHDDVISKDALYQVVKAINDEPDADFLYSDEDKIAEGGARCHPFFKPDWSPELLRCIPYVSHLTVIRKSLLDSIGGFDERFRYSPDYYLQLRATDKARRIVHIPRVLYSWRMTPTSVSTSTSRQKFELLCRENLNELREFAAQKKLGVAEAWPYPNTFRVSYSVKGNPLVTIVILTYDKVDLLRKCLSSIERCNYPNKEILLITNNQDETSSMWAYLRTLPHKVVRYQGEFSWSGMNNRAAEITSGEYLIFLNDDTEVITTDWIERLLEYAQQPDVGAVGCRLLFPGGRCQHAGVTSDMVYVAYHQFKDVIGDGYYGMIMLPREVSAVTGACMMVRKEVFGKLDGFEPSLQYVYNDIDFCWRLGELGYRIIYAASVQLRHLEGASRYGRIDNAAAAHDTLYMLRRWRGKLFGGDPFHSHNLTNARIDPFGIRSFFYPARQDRKNGTSILLVSHNLNLEGSTLGIFNIGKSLRNSGYLVAVISPCDGKLRDAYLKHGIPVLIIPGFGHLASIGDEDLGTFMASFDVIFANTILMYFVVPFVRAFRFPARPKIVWMIRESPNLDDFCREVGTTTQTLQHAFANADSVVFLSKATRDLFAQFDQVGNFAVINDSVDWDDYRDLLRKSSFHFDGNAFNVLSVGTICQHKGQDVLVDAALDLLAKTDCNFKFHFVGKIGNEEFYEALRKKIDRHGMGGRIVFLGELSRRDVVRAYSECSAFVLPSRGESFPTVVLEAMAAGKPIIATKVFGTAEQVVDNHSALVVEPNDKPRLVDALLHIYSDSAFAMRLGDNARKEFLQRFTLKTMARKYQELVEDLISEPLASHARLR